MIVRTKDFACLVAFTVAFAACGSNNTTGGGADSGGGDTGGPLAESGTDAAPESAPPDGSLDAPADVFVETGTGDGVINCGAEVCTVGTQICCYVKAGGNETCTPLNACNVATSVAIPCDDTSDCIGLGHAGDVCCATIGGSGLLSASCKAKAQCAAAGDVQLCNPGDAMPCPSGGTCQTAASLPPGFHGCM
jgi:hypothetical protein